jgi:hypothetical protein
MLLGEINQGHVFILPTVNPVLLPSPTATPSPFPTETPEPDELSNRIRKIFKTGGVFTPAR